MARSRSPIAWLGGNGTFPFELVLSLNESSLPLLLKLLLAVTYKGIPIFERGSPSWCYWDRLLLFFILSLNPVSKALLVIAIPLYKLSFGAVE